MSIILGFFTVIVWTTVVPISMFAALVFLIVGLSTDDRDPRLRRQRLRLALLFAVIPLGIAVALTIVTAITAAVEGAAIAG